MAERLTGARSLIRRERMRGRVTAKAEGLEEALEYFNSFDNRLLNNLGKKVTTALVITQTEIILSIFRHFKQNTGQFRKSFHNRVISRKGSGSKGAPLYGTVMGEIFSDHPGASIQDIGGIITAKGKKLRIPLSDEARKRTPADFGDRLELTGSGYLVERKGFDGTQFHYALRNIVRIKATHYMDDAINRASPAVLEETDGAVRLTVTHGPSS